VIRVLLADDQHLVRGALAALLSLEDDLEVVAEVADGARAVVEARRHRPDVALLDIEMPGVDGLTAAARMRTEVPATRVVILTTFGRPGYLRRALEAGAVGFVLKDAPAAQLAASIRKVYAGERVVDPVLAAATVSSAANPLTSRERDVLRAARGAAPVADIAQALFLSEGTVRNYLSSAIGKTGSRNRTEAVRIAESNGWL
jgi:two-component system, NarL family, response regulator DesR